MRRRTSRRRSRCGRDEPVGEPTDVPGAYVVERVDPARMRPMSRASQLAALVVGSQDGERILDACAAPGGKTTMLRGEVTAVEVHAGPRARRSRRTSARTCASSTPMRASSTRAASTARSSMRRAPASACSRAAPTCAGARGRCPSSSSNCCARRRSGRSPAARSSTRSARSTPTRTRRSSMPPASRSSRSARSGRSTRIRGGRSSCSRGRDRDRTSGFFIARLAYDRVMTWRDWIRRVEVEPSLYARRLRALGDQIDALLDAAAASSIRRRGRPLRRAVTIGPIVLQSIAPLVHERGGAIDVHLMVENPAKYFEPVAKAGGDSVTFHYEAVDDVAATITAARAHGLQVGVAFNPETSRKTLRRSRRRGPRSLHEHPPGLLGPAVPGGGVRPRRAAAELLPDQNCWTTGISSNSFSSASIFDCTSLYAWSFP